MRRRFATLLPAVALLGVAAGPAVPTDVAAPTVYDADADGAPDAVVGAPRYDEWAWADVDEATIHPGTQTVTEGGQCTANFVFVRTAVVDEVEYLVDVLLGTAAHCISSESGADECADTGYPIGTPTEIDGATLPGAAAYNATITMQAVGETDPDTCNHNDIGMIRVAYEDWSRVNPSIPDFGGPVGTNTTGTTQGDTLYSWGNSGLRFGLEQTSPKRGTALATNAGGWNHTFYTVTPGIPGDSGSALLDADGNALAALSTVAIAPFPASNNADDIGRAVQYALDHEPTMAGLRLEPGTEPWDPSPWPVFVP